MNPLRLGICSCAILAMGISLASCGPEPFHQKEERYVFISTNVNLPYWQEAEAGFQDAASLCSVPVSLPLSFFATVFSFFDTSVLSDSLLI